MVPREEVLLLFALASVAYGECRNPRSPSRAAMKSLMIMIEMMIGDNDRDNDNDDRNDDNDGYGE